MNFYDIIGKFITDPLVGLLVNIFLMGIAITSVWEAVRKKRQISTLPYEESYFTFRGKLLISTALAVVIFSFLKDAGHEYQVRVDKIEQDSIVNRNKREIVETVRITKDSSLSQIIRELAKYGLSIERSKDSIIKVIKEDTAKRPINNIASAPDPRIIFCLPTAGVKPNYIRYSISNGMFDTVYVDVCCKNNDAYDLNLSGVVVLVKDKDTIFYPGIITAGKKLADNETYTPQIPVDKNNLNVANELHVLIFGTYFKRGDKTPFYIDEYELVNLKTGNYITSPALEKQIINTLITKSDIVKAFFGVKKKPGK